MVVKGVEYQGFSKLIIFIWMVLSNRVLIWDILLKISFESPRWYPFCRTSSKIFFHMLVGCHFLRNFGLLLEHLLGG
jgi:hypothetical protein